MSFGPPPSMTQPAPTEPTSVRKRGRKVLTALLAVVVAAALGTGGWLLWGGGGENGTPSDKPQAAGEQGPLDVRETVEKQPPGTVGEMAFRFSVDDMAPGEHVEMPGMWATDRILAKGINKTLVGMRIGTDIAPGEEEWRLGLDGPICGYTRHVTGDHRTAVLFRANDREEDAFCNQVAFVDLDDGRLVWEDRFSYSVAGPGPGFATGSSSQDRPSVTLTHDTVAVTWGGGTVGYDMEEGESRWATKATAPCQDMGAAGGRALLIRQMCWSTDESVPDTSWQHVTYKVRKVDPATGRTQWTYSAAKGIRDLSVPSTDPAVLAVAGGDTEITDLLSLDDKGRNRATISLRNGAYVADCAYTDYVVIDDCPTIAVGAGQVFIRSKDQMEKQISNWIIGFDLATGNTTKKFDSGAGSLLQPLRMSGDQLLALRLSDDHIAPNTLVALDPATDEEIPYLYFGLPAEGEPLTLSNENDIVVQDGRIFFGAKSANGPSGDKKKQWTYLVLGIGSSTAGKP
ncbi:PQQ-binding-like beta-propeller repeat protein [Streptomyces sp. BB1-1-1]|uniref:outer membrane protein assembly factor BamB family protein n=1 Tax=Streptomyces sp. BB1-1-1 TaxID=3074430 RepID=UPI0028779A60|nr:PQQ-binding-like beta-propeller repeat protein [Streptomyces sp. BB1-1-1]WND34768.1 PQQ-binding-like beta-propeller repeat protein [Streptomyces sp. BB1-1-1]